MSIAWAQLQPSLGVWLVGEGSWGTAQGFGLWSHTPPPEVSVSKAVKCICSKLRRGDFF